MNFTKPLNASTTPPCWYSPDTNPRQKLRNYAKHISPELYTIFRTPILDEREYHLFDLLKRGYIDARYKPDYRITADELQILIEKVTRMQEVVKRICTEKINSLNRLLWN